jgi:gmma-aminobutyric acid receptor subunit gamma/cGMP-dependent protein kinase 2
MNDSSTILKFDDGDETAYREEVKALAEWCQENSLSLNVSKT